MPSFYQGTLIGVSLKTALLTMTKIHFIALQFENQRESTVMETAAPRLLPTSIFTDCHLCWTNYNGFPFIFKFIHVCGLDFKKWSLIPMYARYLNYEDVSRL